MLQQTRAETVVPYYARFLEAFPDVHALAGAELTEVLKLFEGLGYYARARNLHKAAKVIASGLGGEFPRDVKSLRKLPGVGEYTAGAIASITYGIPAPAIDGNQMRVLSRLFAIRGKGTPKARSALVGAADGLLSYGRPGDINQALMGLGAMVCTAMKPSCDVCCVKDLCAAHAQCIEEELPERSPKTDKRVQSVAVVLIFLSGGVRRVFVRQRPDDALLGGLWEFPCFVEAETISGVSACVREIGIEARGYRELAALKHVFTHLVWNMTGYSCTADEAPQREGMWVDAEALSLLPMSTAMRGYRALAAGILGAHGEADG